ncbi:MAG: PRC-barrel domain-containing protein [Candidatus Micrarchaeota archaeon]|nr:PRC-barrel domain-containing protein [Candidatus Micrarchaeota archaeon]
MSIRLSKLYGMDIFSDAGKYLGKVYDIIVDVEKGEVVRLTLESIHTASREDAQRIIKEKTVLYKNVRSLEDVIVVSKGASQMQYSYQPSISSREDEGSSNLSFLK